MRRVAVINQKGGVGKTTTTVNLGAALARAGKRVLLIDLDPQSHLTLHMGIDPATRSGGTYEALTQSTPLDEVRKQIAPNLWMIGSHIDLAAAEVELVSTVGREVILRDLLDAHSTDYDYVLMDCPPSLGVLTLNALSAAKEVFIPLQPHYLALHGLSKLLETVSLVARRINPPLRVTGVVVCMHEPGTRLASEVLEDVTSFLHASESGRAPWAGARVFKTPIRRNIKLAECPSHGVTIFDYAPQSNGAEDYTALAVEVRAMVEPELAQPAPAPAPAQGAPKAATAAAVTRKPKPTAPAAQAAPAPAATLTVATAVAGPGSKAPKPTKDRPTHKTDNTKAKPAPAVPTAKKATPQSPPPPEKKTVPAAAAPAATSAASAAPVAKMPAPPLKEPAVATAVPVITLRAARATSATKTPAPRPKEIAPPTAIAAATVSTGSTAPPPKAPAPSPEKSEATTTAPTTATPAAAVKKAPAAPRRRSAPTTAIPATIAPAATAGEAASDTTTPVAAKASRHRKPPAIAESRREAKTDIAPEPAPVVKLEPASVPPPAALSQTG